MPALQLNIGDGRIAEYLSGSGTKNINFRYEVQAGDMSAALDLSSEAAFLDRGAALIDRAGNNVLQGLQLAKPGQLVHSAITPRLLSTRMITLLLRNPSFVD